MSLLQDGECMLCILCFIMVSFFDVRNIKTVVILFVMLGISMISFSDSVLTSTLCFGVPTAVLASEVIALTN